MVFKSSFKIRCAHYLIITYNRIDKQQVKKHINYSHLVSKRTYAYKREYLFRSLELQ